MRKLLALLYASGFLTVGGTGYQVASPRDGVSLVDLRDAGVAVACDPIQMTCQVRQTCSPALARYRTVSTFAYQCTRAGPDLVIVRWPRASGRDCIEPVGDEPCVFNGASFDDGGTADVRPAQDRCACRARGQTCRWTQPDAGLALMNFNQTYAALQAPFVGGGCTRKACEEFFGESGQSLPEACQ